MTQQPSQPNDALEKAWGRIGLSTWDQMAWFVKLANAGDLSMLSPGDVQNLQDECQAIRMKPRSFHGTPLDRKRYPFLHGWVGSLSPSLTQLQDIQSAVASRLKSLLDGDNTYFHSVPETTRFRKSTDVERRNEYPPHLIYHISTAGSWPNEFLSRMVRLLEQPRKGGVLFVDSIRRCPHCDKAFLQLRRNATYCGRKCHSVAGMQRLRAEQKALKMKKEQQLRTANRKRGLRHGKTKR